MEGAIEKTNLAKGYMQRGDIALKASHISWAISIIDGLRMSLDIEADGEIAKNLDDLYDYLGRRLAEANQNNSVDMLKEKYINNLTEKTTEPLNPEAKRLFLHYMLDIHRDNLFAEYPKYMLSTLMGFLYLLFGYSTLFIRFFNI